MASTFRNMMREMQLPHLEKEVKKHLTKVYTCTSLALIVCAAGSYLHITGIITAGFLTGMACMSTLLAITFMPRTQENHGLRFGLLMATSLLFGIVHGPLLSRAIAIDPSIVITALLATSLVFLCFSLASLTSPDRKWLAIGGVLSSALSWMLLLGFMNLFIQSTLIYEMKTYISLATFCGFVLYDTQLIVEKCRDGNDDYIDHCLMLFVDFVTIFRDILMLLTEKEEGRSGRRRRRSD